VSDVGIAGEGADVCVCRRGGGWVPSKRGEIVFDDDRGRKISSDRNMMRVMNIVGEVDSGLMDMIVMIATATMAKVRGQGEEGVER